MPGSRRRGAGVKPRCESRTGDGAKPNDRPWSTDHARSDILYEKCRAFASCCSGSSGAVRDRRRPWCRPPPTSRSTGMMCSRSTCSRRIAGAWRRPFNEDFNPPRVPRPMPDRKNTHRLQRDLGQSAFPFSRRIS